MAFSVSQEQKFSMPEIFYNFKLCLSANEEVFLEQYAAGCRGILRYINSYGPNFDFIVNDTMKKVDNMEKLHNGENGAHYITIQSMVKYELENGLVELTREGSESGTRACLTFHRALSWLIMLMEKLRDSNADEQPSQMFIEAYKGSRYADSHTWLVHQATAMAFGSLPDRTTFFDGMGVGGEEQAVAMLQYAIPIMSEVHRVTEEVYAENNLLELP